MFPFPPLSSSLSLLRVAVRSPGIKWTGHLAGICSQVGNYCLDYASLPPFPEPCEVTCIPAMKDKLCALKSITLGSFLSLTYVLITFYGLAELVALFLCTYLPT